MTAPSGLPFAIDKRLGGGRYAEVFGARTSAGPAVLKLARPEPLDVEGATGAVFWSRRYEFVTGTVVEGPVDPNEVLEAEERVLRRLASPLFVKLQGSGTVDIDGQTRRYLLLERVLGRNWREALASSAPPQLRHVAELAKGLATAVAKKELSFHGDLKPDNLLLDVKGTVRLIDPASASWQLDARGKRERALVTEVYNPLYVPSDVPALGLVAWEIIVGQQPFVFADPTRQPHGVSPALADKLSRLAAVGHGRIYGRVPYLELPTEAQPSVPAALEALLLRCIGLVRTDKGLEVSDDLPTLEEVAKVLGEHAAWAPAPARPPASR